MNRKDDALVFQIGFDRCGTSSLYRLFRRSGYGSLHFLHKHKHIYSVIRQNILRGDHPTKGYEDFVFFSDIKLITKNYSDNSTIRNGSKFFPLFESNYPKAKFILNIRKKENWINSRLGNPDINPQSKILELQAKDWGMRPEKLLEFYENEWNWHIAKIKSYFVGDKEKKLVIFNIEEDPLDKLIDFMSPEFHLQAEFWEHLNKGIKEDPPPKETASSVN